MARKVIFIRSNPVNPDPRVEKEMEALAKSGYEIKLISWNREESSGISFVERNLKNLKIKTFSINIKSGFGLGLKKNFIPLIKFQYNVLKVLIRNKDKYDIIHACDFDTVIPAYLCSKLFKKIYIYDIFDYYVDAFSVPNILKKVVQIIDYHMINKSEATIICTEKRVEQISGSHPKRLLTIHNTPTAIEHSLKEENKRIKGEKMKIAYVGILGESRLLKEMIEIIKDAKDYELHIGGFGYLEEYIRCEANKSKNIKFYGRLSYDEVLNLESNCDVMTAIYDPEIRNHKYAAPNKFYEALMLGKPLIVCKGTGIDSVVIKNNIGEVIDYNKESLKEALKSLYNKRNMWDEISINMKKIYMKEYEWDKMEKRLVDLYEKI